MKKSTREKAQGSLLSHEALHLERLYKMASEKMDDSFENSRDSIDLTSVIAEFPFNDDHPQSIPVKKLNDTFDNCITKGEETGMKVYLRVRPTKGETTIVVDSNTSIVTTAPDVSKRALYTKMESRHYVSSTLLAPIRR